VAFGVPEGCILFSGFPRELEGAQNPGFLKKPGFLGMLVVSSGAWRLKMMSWRQPTWKTIAFYILAVAIAQM
jgi:hypothetical protein